LEAAHVEQQKLVQDLQVCFLEKAFMVQYLPPGNSLECAARIISKLVGF